MLLLVLDLEGVWQAEAGPRLLWAPLGEFLRLRMHQRRSLIKIRREILAILESILFVRLDVLV